MRRFSEVMVIVRFSANPRTTLCRTTEGKINIQKCVKILLGGNLRPRQNCIPKTTRPYLLIVCFRQVTAASYHRMFYVRALGTLPLQ